MWVYSSLHYMMSDGTRITDTEPLQLQSILLQFKDGNSCLTVCLLDAIELDVLIKLGFTSLYQTSAKSHLLFH